MIKIVKNKAVFPKELMPVTVQSFTHVYNAMVLFWGTKEFSEYINKTIITDRLDQKGFPPVVMKELFALQLAHDKEFPQFVQSNMWDEYPTI